MLYATWLYMCHSCGWRAGNNRLNFVWPGQAGQSMCQAVTATRFTTVMNIISTLWVGTHEPH